MFENKMRELLLTLTYIPRAKVLNADSKELRRLFLYYWLGVKTDD